MFVEHCSRLVQCDLDIHTVLLPTRPYFFKGEQFSHYCTLLRLPDLCQQPFPLDLLLLNLVPHVLFVLQGHAVRPAVLIRKVVKFK